MLVSASLILFLVLNQVDKSVFNCNIKMGFISAFRGSSAQAGIGDSSSGNETVRGVMEMVQGATGVNENQVSAIVQVYQLNI